MSLLYPEPSTGFTTVKPTTIAGRIIQFPLVRLIIGVLFITPASLIHRGEEKLTSRYLTNSYPDLATIIDAVVGIALLLLVYWLYTRYIERRPATELSLKGAASEFGIGLGVAVMVIGTVLALIYLFGGVVIQSGGETAWSLLVSFMFFSDSALVEEIIFRLLLFRLSEEWLGSWPAILIQALFFGFAHGGNPNADLWSSVSIAVSAGGLLAAMYMYTRRIWMVWGIHLLFNYLQRSVLGLPVSGTAGTGVFSTELSGSDWVTGGAFGIEASVFTPLVCLIVGYWFLMKAVKSGKIVAPSWIRNRQELPPLQEEPAG